MANDTPKRAQVFFTPLQRAVFEAESETFARAQRIDREQYDPNTTAGGDKKLASQHQHIFGTDPLAKKKNFDEKVYLFPESYNALRRELHENWRGLFENVNPHTGCSLAYAMVYDAPQFIAVLNGALDLVVQVDTDNVDGICKTFLNGLRVKRGVKPFVFED